jgi:hypothetical protein
MDLLPEIRSSSEIYGYLTDGSLQGVPISGVIKNKYSVLKKVHLPSHHQVGIMTGQVDPFFISDGLCFCLGLSFFFVSVCVCVCVCVCERERERETCMKYLQVWKIYFNFFDGNTTVKDI